MWTLVLLWPHVRAIIHQAAPDRQENESKYYMNVFVCLSFQRKWNFSQHLSRVETAVILCLYVKTAQFQLSSFLGNFQLDIETVVSTSVRLVHEEKP